MSVEPERTDPRAIAAGACALAGLLLFGVLLGVVAVVLGWPAYRSAAASQDPAAVRSRRWALVALVLGPLDVIVGILVFL